MKNQRPDETTGRASAEARAETLSRPLARSLVLYAVLGTLALQAGGGQPSRAQEPRPRQPSPQSGVNRRQFDALPLKALLRRARGMYRRGELSLAHPATFTFDADVQEDGTLTPGNVTYTGDVDPATGNLLRDLAVALDQSRVAGALEGVSHFRLTLALDGQDFRADALADFATPEQAARLARDYDTLLQLARVAKRNAPEAAVFNNMTVSASGKQLSLKLDMTREALGQLLHRQVTPN